MKDSTQREPRPEHCPACDSSRVAELFYGLPPSYIDFKPRFDAEEFRFADKPWTEESPEWHCCACHHEWGITHLAPMIRAARLAKEKKQRDPNA
jgi:hypothetical protein